MPYIRPAGGETSHKQDAFLCREKVVESDEMENT